jgi:hypothetical protein
MSICDIGTRTGAEKISEKEKSGIQEHLQVRKARNNIVDSFESLKMVVLQIIIELLIQEQHQISKNVSL